MVLSSQDTISATSDDKPSDEKPRVKPLKVTTSVDVLKVSKRARQITNLEGGPFQGIGDKRGFIAMRREILAKPEFVYATGGGEEGAAIEYFYVMNNISAPLQQQVTSQCRSNDCANFEDRVSTMWDCLRRSSDLNDQLSLIRRWETLSCNSSKTIEFYISQIEGMREQLEDIRKVPLSDTEMRSRLYSGLPEDGQRFLDTLPNTAVDSYIHMLFEARRWAQLDDRYSVKATTSSTRVPKITTPSKPAAKRQGNMAELYYTDVRPAPEPNPDARCVFTSGVPPEWGFREVKELVQDLLGEQVSVYVKTLPRRGCVSLRFNDHGEAQRFIENSNGVRFSGRLLRSRFDKYERSTTASPVTSASTGELRTPLSASRILDDTMVDSCPGMDMAMQTDDGEKECSIGVRLDAVTAKRCTVDRSTVPYRPPARTDTVDPFQEPLRPKSSWVTCQLSRTPSGLPQLPVILGTHGLEIKALIDSGATDLFMSSSTYERLDAMGETLTLRPCDTQVGMIDGTGCDIMGRLVGLRLQLGQGVERIADCFVLHHSRHALVLPQALLSPCVWGMNGNSRYPDQLLFGPEVCDLVSGLVPPMLKTTITPTPVSCNLLEEMPHDPDGQPRPPCEVSIPWRGDARPTQNFDQVWQRDKRVVERLKRNPATYKMFCQAVKELLDAGVVDIMPKDGDPKTFARYYIATVPVVNLSRSSTKVRLCLDARQLNCYTTTTGDNSTDADLHLFSTLIKWRSNRAASTDDLSKAFWSVGVMGLQDRVYLGMIINQMVVRWRRVPFGTNWSPWALTSSIRRALNTLCPLRRASIGCYMDDMVIVAQDLEEVEATRDAAIQALEQHGFRINQAKRAHNLDTYDYAIGVPRQPNFDDENRGISFFPAFFPLF